MDGLFVSNGVLHALQSLLTQTHELEHIFLSVSTVAAFSVVVRHECAVPVLPVCVHRAVVCLLYVSFIDKVWKQHDERKDKNSGDYHTPHTEQV